MCCKGYCNCCVHKHLSASDCRPIGLHNTAD
jgi:hypothetical protein